VWDKKGKILSIENLTDQMVSHVLGPTILVRDDSIRIYFSSRNEKNQSYPYYLDVDKDDPLSINHIEKKPLLELGALGTFDDDGVMPCSVVRLDDQTVYLYYIGWNRGVTVAYRNAIGLAVSHDGGNHFERMFEGPIIDRHKNEPHMAASPCVMKEGGLWHCWYTSGTQWITVNKKTEPVYTIRYAHSDNGIDWVRDGHECMTQLSEYEAFARPTVIKDRDLYRMWYNFRSSYDYRDGEGSYQIGYAESYDAKNWLRKDSESGIARSQEGWDSLMQCYPFVIKVGRKLLMFYNGNGFGKSGVGFAEFSRGESWQRS